MSDLFKLFDGGFSAGGGSAVTSQTNGSFSSVDPENSLAVRLSSGTDHVRLLVDYSDFSNFVTFNSAQSYVTITADKILNEYPVDGTQDDVQAFVDALDGFQLYFLDNWPSCDGHLRFNPAVSSSYLSVTDFGVDAGVARTSFISPGTGSLSICGWIDAPSLTGSTDVSVVFQKTNASGDGVSVYLSGSQTFCSWVSGSTTTLVSGTVPARPFFFSTTFDRTSVTGTLSMYLGTTGTFPSLSDSTAIGFATRLDLGSGTFYVGSGSLPGKITRPFTGSMDDLTVWSTVRDLVALTASFNVKPYAQPGLLAAWRFNDALSGTDRSAASITRDSSGHRLDGRIQNYYPALRGSGSLSGDSREDPVLSLSDPSVVDYIVTAQQSGSDYDRSNPSIIFELFPAAFSETDDSGVFANFALTLARHFDRINLYVRQLVNMYRVHYGDFDQAPDELLAELGRFMGWELTGGFIDADAGKFFFGTGITAGPQGNLRPNSSPNDIKAAIWRRLLLNLIHVYKTKGTRESVDALLRIHGADAGFVRLKEYARKTESRLTLERVDAEKSQWALMFVSGATVSFSG